MQQPDDRRAADFLDRLIRERGETFSAISRLIGRNPAYIQQFVKRGTPRKLDECDRRLLARYFDVDEALLGGPEEPSRQLTQSADRDLIVVPRLALDASAGPGAVTKDEISVSALAFDIRWLHALGGKPDMLSIIRVKGESMCPTLNDGDDIMVDRSDGVEHLRDGIYVLRIDDALMVKRLARTPHRNRLSIRSDNSLYSCWDDVDPAEITIIGRIIWAGRCLK